jgi:MerR family transcriptional regulator, repressor of the yfmOP operon
MTLTPPPTAESGFLKIQEVASELGLTTRSIRYYEELGLLSPAGRSDGSYRLYDASDVERLRFIKGLRDDAGFSLAEISQLLEDEAARVRSREAYSHTVDPLERRSIVVDSLARVERQKRTLQDKISRLEVMVVAVEARHQRLTRRLADLDAGGTGDVR